MSETKPMFYSDWVKNAPFTKEFWDLCLSLNGVSGVYCFSIFTENGQLPVYIGKSNNLGARIPSSYADKKNKFKDLDIFVSYISCNNPDAGILELWFIDFYKPPFNKKDKELSEKLTVTVHPIPMFLENIRVMR